MEQYNTNNKLCSDGSIEKVVIKQDIVKEDCKALLNSFKSEKNTQELEELTLILEGIHECLNDTKLTLINVSDSFLDLFGYTVKEIEESFSNYFINMIHPKDKEYVLGKIKEQLKYSDVIEFECRVRNKNGQTIWILDKGKLIVDTEGRLKLCCFIIDITQQKVEREQLVLSLERYKLIMDQTIDIIFEWDIDKDTLYFSGNWCKKFGYSAISSNISKRIPLTKNIYSEDISDFVRIMKETASGIPHSEIEIRIRDINGNYIWCRIRATTQYDSNKRPIKVVGVVTDINNEKREQQNLVQLAQKDGLTGLLNKVTVQNLIKKSLEEYQCKQGALLIIDIDDFKVVNDNFGHLCGDSLIADLAQILIKQFQSSDLIGRIGGDEFIVFLPGISTEHIIDLSDNLVSNLSRIQINNSDYHLSCSIGCSFYPKDGKDFNSLYKAADIALYHAKKFEKGKFVIYKVKYLIERMSREKAYSVVNTLIESEIDITNLRISQYCFQKLYNATYDKTEKSIYQVMEIIGITCDVSRVYIFENSENNLYFSNTFEWCADGIAAQIGNLQNYEIEQFDYLEYFNEDRIFYCQDISQLDQRTYELLKFQNVKSVLQCGLWDNNKLMGFIGFDECREKRTWTENQIQTLTLVANILSTFLTKYRMKQLQRCLKKEDKT